MASLSAVAVLLLLKSNEYTGTTLRENLGFQVSE